MKVLVKEKIAEAGVEKLKEAGFDVNFAPEMSRDEMLNVIDEYDGLIVRSATKVDEEIISKASNLRVIGRAGIGVDNIDVDTATKRGIIVANAPQSNIISVAEHTIALLLAQSRLIPQACSSMRSGKWEKSKFMGAEVYDKTLGIIGLGRIGALVATRARGLGMKTLAYDPYVSVEKFRQMGIEAVEKLEDLLKKADFITIHLPKTKETLGLIGKKEFSLMKDGVRIVNTARGGIVDEEALTEAIKSGKVASVGIDVYSNEPYIEGSLLGLEQVVLTPHIAASTQEAQDKAGIIVAEQVIAALNG
ncbi:MAG TPA: phosphoglycerate dehydrogenase, partial [Actinobacteria bacterium]|nr:phosphoglycerate dehydrogenase [Actinomycetota bacterium]